MECKTCGTCANGTTGNVLWCDSYDEPRFAGDRACGGYAERAGSVERVALDMLEMMRAATKHPIVLRPNAIRGGQIVMQDPVDAFADRLHVLGVGE